MVVDARRLEAYVLALAVTILAAAVQLSLAPLVRLPPLLMFFPALLIAGWWGGVAPAMASLVVGAAASAVYLFEPRGQLSVARTEDVAALALFLLAGGAVAYLAGSFKRAHEHADSERQRLQSYLTATTDSVIIVDRQWRCTFANPSAAALLRRPAAELAGMPFTEIFPESQTVPLVHQAGQTMRDRTPRRVEHFDMTRGVWFEHEIHPIGSGVSFFFRDVTARHRDAAAQAELLRREQAARRDSEEASRLKDEFVATVSHELRTPLNAILGWSRLLQQAHCDQAVVARALEAIERNASAQAQLVEDLLDIARITSGKLRLEVRPVTLGEVVEAAVETVRPSAAAKSIHIELDQAPGPILVSGDPDRLQQVVWNLLTNAVKFTSMGGRVHVQLRHAESHVLLSVCDTGIGIGPDLLPHVFERFRQAETGSARRHSGLGLGLALVRQLVELHGGTVSAESPGRGRGATFTIALPRLAPAEAAAMRPEVAPVTDLAAPQWTLPDLTGLPLLIVDDSEDARAMMAQILERQGAIVSVAGSADEALHVLEQAGPQVVLSDIEMPDRDGYWLVRRLREHPDPRVRNVPAIAVTAYARVQDRTRALLAGFHHHLAKPIDPAELVALVSRAAAGRLQT